VGARSPDQFGAREQEVLVEVVPGAGDDTGSPRAPLETDASAAAGIGELRARRAGPIREAVLAEGVASKDSGGLGDRVVGLEATQGERVAGGAVHAAETAVIVVLPPESVLAATGMEDVR
jgi:hypothetical protein